jgi:hypothetical protein
VLQGVKSLFKQLRKDFKIARGTTEEATFRVVFEKVFYDCAKNARKAAASRGVQVAPGKGCAGGPRQGVCRWPPARGVQVAPGKPGRRSSMDGVVAASDSDSE